MLKRAVPVGAALAACVAVAALFAADKPKAAEENPFRGKALVVQTKDSMYHLLWPRVKQLGERSFVVGQDIESREATRWIPADAVTTMSEFADAAELKKLYRVPGGGAAAGEKK